MWPSQARSTRDLAPRSPEKRSESRYSEALLIIGEPLGAGVAAASARQREMVTGLLLITPWDRTEHVAGHRYPLLQSFKVIELLAKLR